MSDIVERIRSEPHRVAPGLALEAADEITRLRAILLRISCYIETEANVDVEVIYDEIRRAFE